MKHDIPRNKHLLVIDDEQDICELVTDIAELTGFTSEQCIELEDLNTLTLEPMPDVIALDLSMPKIDGIEVINFLGQYPVKPQLVLMSGFERAVLDGAHKLADRLQIPVLGQLSKPFSVSNLKTLLEQPLPAPEATRPVQSWANTAQFTAREVEEALEAGQFIAYFQPQIDLKTGELHGTEALVRWHHPSGVIMPDQFLPLIESEKLILPLTRSVIEQSLQQQAQWQAGGLKNIQISINLSAAYFDELNLPELMQELLSRYPADPKNITLEITERIGFNNSNQNVLDTLTRLRLKGFYLSIDDFGTGYSSLSQLNQLPFNEIKIDKSFVQHMMDSPISKAIVESSISLAAQLGVRCVAEGIESQEIAHALTLMGCDIGQGYLYNKALPPEAFMVWAQNYTRPQSCLNRH